MSSKVVRFENSKDLLDQGMVCSRPHRTHKGEGNNINDLRFLGEIIDQFTDSEDEADRDSVVAYMKRMDYYALLASGNYQERLVMFPGCAPGWYLGKKTLIGMMRYEVTIKYTNRPDVEVEL